MKHPLKPWSTNSSVQNLTTAKPWLIPGLPRYQLNRLQLLLNTTARVVTYTRKYDHITPVLIKLHWLPVYYRALFKVLLLVFKVVKGLAQHYVSDLLNKHVSVLSLRFNSQEPLNFPRSRTKTYDDRAFSVTDPRLWNELPVDIGAISDVNAFKRSLKTYLFRQAYLKYLWAKIFTFSLCFQDIVTVTYYKVVFIRTFLLFFLSCVILLLPSLL